MLLARLDWVSVGCGNEPRAAASVFMRMVPGVVSTAGVPVFKACRASMNLHYSSVF